MGKLTISMAMFHVAFCMFTGTFQSKCILRCHQTWQWGLSRFADGFSKFHRLPGKSNRIPPIKNPISKHTNNYGHIHHFQWVNQRTKWPFSIAMSNYGRNLPFYSWRNQRFSNKKLFLWQWLPVRIGSSGIWWEISSPSNPISRKSPVLTLLHWKYHDDFAYFWSAI